MNDFQEEGAAQTIAILRDEIITERGFTEEWRNQLLRARNRNTDLQRQLEAATEEISEYQRILIGKTKRITKARQTIKDVSELPAKWRGGIVFASGLKIEHTASLDQERCADELQEALNRSKP